MTSDLLSTLEVCVDDYALYKLTYTLLYLSQLHVVLYHWLLVHSCCVIMCNTVAWIGWKIMLWQFTKYIYLAASVPCILLLDTSKN